LGRAHLSSSAAAHGTRSRPSCASLAGSPSEQQMKGPPPLLPASDRAVRTGWGGAGGRGRSLPMQTVIPPYLTEALNLGDTLAAGVRRQHQATKGPADGAGAPCRPRQKGAELQSRCGRSPQPASQARHKAGGRRRKERLCGPLRRLPGDWGPLKWPHAPKVDMSYRFGGGQTCLRRFYRQAKGIRASATPPCCPWAGLAGEREGALGFEGLRWLLLGLQESSTERRSPLVPSLQRRSCWALALVGGPARVMRVAQ